VPNKALDMLWCTTYGGMHWHGHYMIRDPVRFLFVDMARLVNREFGLQTQSVLFAALGAFATRQRVVVASAFALHYPAQGGRLVRQVIPISHVGKLRVCSRSIRTRKRRHPFVYRRMNVLLDIASRWSVATLCL
jgi:hypothetical protein